MPKSLRTTLLAASAIFLGITIGSKGAQPTTRPAEPSPPKALPVYFFYSLTCPKCAETFQAIDAVERHYGARIHIERLDIQNRKSFERMLAMEDAYGSNEPAPPKVFVGKQYLAGFEAISKRLDAVVAEELARPGAPGATSQPATAPTSTSAPATMPSAN